MGWRDLIQASEEVVLPWVGGRDLRTAARSFRLGGRLPAEYGWYGFEVSGSRGATLKGARNAATETLLDQECGYLVGDRFVSDRVVTHLDIATLVETAPTVFLVDTGLDRFSRIRAGRVFSGGPFVYVGLEMPLGPETEVLNAFLDKATSVADVKNVAPGLDMAFRMESWQRDEAEKRRLELERLRREEEERLAREERRRQIAQQMGTAVGRREMARIDFAEAARAALRLSDAELLDHRAGERRGEHVVRFRFIQRRFECVCDDNLRIIDSGICLNAHYDDPDFEEGTRGDTWLTLESLPGVIREANDTHRLVVFRHI